MSLDLDAFVGSGIRDLCLNGFTADNINHCAHFVSHVLGLNFSYNCREHTGGSGTGANIRVHELFTHCPLVGHWDDADTSKPLIIFVTRADHVNVVRKEMVNHPQKHVGIFQDGNVYHYSNSRDQVVRQDVDAFFQVFEQVYTGTQGLFFGIIPGSDLDLDVDLTATRDVHGIPFVIEERAGQYFARTGDEPSFFVGKPVRYHSNRGLYHPPSRYYGPTYMAEDYYPRYDHWANVLEAIGHCEGKNHFNLLNSYDRAAFTFGFVQFAAHTPKDNLILLFRELLRRPEASDYFPELELRNERVHRINQDGSATDLELPQNGRINRFMHYLNPNGQDVDNQELLHAARLIHWANSEPSMRDAQVKTAVNILSEKVIQRYHRWYGLAGKSDLIVTLICDIHHQGRASRSTVQNALDQSNAVTALLRVNHAQWRDRNERLEQVTQMMVDAGKLGQRVYDPANNEFILAENQASLNSDVSALPPLPPDPIPIPPPTPPTALRLG